jgi:hypothetical protein
VEPKTATSGWTPEDEYVGQSFIANVDSLLYAEWFVAELSQSGRYKFEIREQGTGRLVGSGDTTMPVHGWQWIRCDNWTLGDRSFVKGREYLLKVYHSTGDSVNYVVRTDNPYSYGLMMVPGQNPPIPLTWDLCARVYGEMRPCPAQYWGTVPELQYVPAELRGTWLARAESARIGWAHIPIYWDSTQTDSGGAFDFSRLDTELPYIRDSAGCQIHANVTLCPTWASSRLDGSHYCPPRNLWAAGDANWWAVFLDTLVRHCDAIGCSLHEISIWNEENDTGPPSSGITGWFRHPDTIFYPGVDTGLRGLCSLYVRMVAVAAATIHSIPGHASDRISLGGLFRSTASARHLVSGVDWLRTCYDIAGDSVPWDVVSVHPYQDWAVMFSSSTLEADASALRAVMDSCGHGGAELWNIEFGVDAEHCSEERFAAGMFEMYAVSRGSEALPEGGYDRACWFYFWWPSLWGSWGMVRSDGTPTAGFYAFKQMTQALTGLRCNGRVMAGDSRDDSVRMYEFEDTTTLKRTWVCWKNGGQGQNEVDVKLPVRSDSLAGEALDYTGSPPIPLLSTGLDGWLPLALGVCRETGFSRSESGV